MLHMYASFTHVHFFKYIFTRLYIKCMLSLSLSTFYNILLQIIKKLKITYINLIN